MLGAGPAHRRRGDSLIPEGTALQASRSHELAQEGLATRASIHSLEPLCLKYFSGPRCSLSFNSTPLPTSRNYGDDPSQVPKASWLSLALTDPRTSSRSCFLHQHPSLLKPTGVGPWWSAPCSTSCWQHVQLRA